jgi:uncharacterized membrane protein YbaN (DUF454 family)
MTKSVRNGVIGTMVLATSLVFVLVDSRWVHGFALVTTLVVTTVVWWRVYNAY